MVAITPPNPSLDFLKLLGHDVRWHLLAALAESDRRVQELVALLQRPQNLISYHLRLLREGDLVRERRSSGDGRDVYYSLDLERLQKQYQESGQTLHPALLLKSDQEKYREMVGERFSSKRPCRVLFLCTHNSARSQLAEGILRAKAGGSVEVFSAGSEPSGIHPLAIETAKDLDIDISKQRSQHMDEFSGQSFDVVITVCDKVREICAVFPNETKQIHWSFPDPAEVTGSERDRLEAFRQTAKGLSTRIRYFLVTTAHN